MTKLYIAIAVMAISYLNLSATPATLDPNGQAVARRIQIEKKHNTRLKMAPAKAPMMTALVKLASDDVVDSLAMDESLQVTKLRGPFAVVCCAPERAAAVAAKNGVVKCEFNRAANLNLRDARMASRIDPIHVGTELPQPYTGKGVVTGIVDAGFDPNHINFRDADGNVGIDYLFDMGVAADGSVRKTVYDSNKLASYITDDNTQTHGTHTLGIMAGRYKGDLTLAQYDSDANTVSVSTVANPFGGIAPESSIMAATGADYEATIAYGIDAILDYRWNEGYRAQPIVLNLSLGGNAGPHDGTGILAQYLDWAQSNDGLVTVVAAGNDGDVPTALTHIFSDDGEEIRTFIRPYVYNDLRYGSVEVYSDSAEPFDISIIIYNSKRGTIARTFPLTNTDGIIQYICSDGYQEDDSDVVDPTFSKAYEGYVGLVGTFNEQSGRFYSFIDLYAVNAEANPADPDTSEAQYTLGFVIKGKKGQRIDCYADGGFVCFDDYGTDGYTKGQRNGTISDLATCKTAIVVGSYNTMEYAGGLKGDVLGYDGYYKNGEVTEFSAYGTLVDGRNLPHIVAPGCMVVSSISKAYIENAENGEDESMMTAVYNDGKRDHYFRPEIGTSMSAPVVAGTIALWLEADPTLDYNDCIDILQKTAVKDEYWDKAEDPVQWGAGRLDAYAGIKEVIRRSGINDVTVDDGRLLVRRLSDRMLEVCLPGEKNIMAQLFDMSGRKAACFSSGSDEVTIDGTSLTPGVYLLTVNNNVIKILIK